MPPPIQLESGSRLSMNQKLGILTVLATVLLSAAVLATPGLKSGKAQANQTAHMNATHGAQGLPEDKWIIVLKKDNPALAKIEQKLSCKGRYCEDKSNARRNGSC